MKKKRKIVKDEFELYLIVERNFYKTCLKEPDLGVPWFEGEREHAIYILGECLRAYRRYLRKRKKKK